MHSVKKKKTAFFLFLETDGLSKWLINNYLCSIYRIVFEINTMSLVLSNISTIYPCVECQTFSRQISADSFIGDKNEW